MDRQGACRWGSAAIEKEKSIEEFSEIRTNVSRETFPLEDDFSEREKSLLVEMQDAEDLLSFQLRLWDLLDRRVKLYTSGESSSLPLLKAHEMLAAVLFVLGLDSRNVDPAEIRHVLALDLNEEFEQKLKAICKKTKQVSEVWKEVVLSTPLLESRALKDSLNSLKNFEAQYNPLYFAHEIPADIDYPLCDPVPEDYRGVNYAYEYLRRLKFENNFLNKFDVGLCKRLLRSVAPDYRELIINLYEPVATNAIGLALAGKSPHLLNASASDHRAIIEEFKGAPTKKAYKLLSEAAEFVCESLKIEHEEEQAYLQKMAIALYPRIKVLAPKGDISGIFLSFS